MVRPKKIKVSRTDIRDQADIKDLFKAIVVLDKRMDKLEETMLAVPTMADIMGYTPPTAPFIGKKYDEIIEKVGEKKSQSEGE